MMLEEDLNPWREINNIKWKDTVNINYTMNINKDNYIK